MRRYTLAAIVLALVVGLIHFLPPKKAVAAACSEIPVGATLSLTGQYSTGGVLTRDGYEFAVSQIKKAGGIEISGRCYVFRVIYYDDESIPSRAEVLTRQLIEKDRVQFLLGPYAPDLAAAVAPLAELSATPTIVAQPMPGTLNLSSKSNGIPEKQFVFRMMTPSAGHLSVAIDTAIEVANSTSPSGTPPQFAATFAGDLYNRNLAAAFRQQADRTGVELLQEEHVASDQLALRSFLARVKGNASDVLMVSAHAHGTLATLKLIQEMQVHVPLLVMTHCRAADIIGRFGAAADNIVCAARPRQSLDPTAGVFANAALFDRAYVEYKLQVSDRASTPRAAASESASAPHHMVPDEVTQAAMAVHVLAAAIRRAASRDREQVRAALTEIDVMTVYGNLRFDAAGRAVAAPLVLYQVQNGTYNVVAPSKLATHNLNWPRGGL